jgi:hypothetical protein
MLRRIRISKSKLSYLFFVSALIVSIIYWVDFLNSAAFSIDRMFYISGFEEKRERLFEPVWVGYTLLAYNIWGDFSYEFTAFAIVAFSLVALLRLNLRPWQAALVLFSPGFSYFLTNALRQGFALSLFLLFISFFYFRWHQKKFTCHIIFVFIVSLCSLIHNSIFIAGLFVFLIEMTRHGMISPGRLRIIYIVLIFLAFILLLFSDSISGMAAFFILLNFFVLFSSLLMGKFDARHITLGLYFLFCQIGYIATGTGLRVVLMLSMVAFALYPTTRIFSGLIGLYLNPLLQYGGYLIEDAEDQD